MSEGDHVNDLYILLQGGIELLDSRLPGEAAIVDPGVASTHGGRRQVRGVSWPLLAVDR